MWPLRSLSSSASDTISLSMMYLGICTGWLNQIDHRQSKKSRSLTDSVNQYAPVAKEEFAQRNLSSLPVRSMASETDYSCEGAERARGMRLNRERRRARPGPRSPCSWNGTVGPGRISRLEQSSIRPVEVSATIPYAFRTLP